MSDLKQQYWGKTNISFDSDQLLFILKVITIKKYNMFFLPS